MKKIKRFKHLSLFSGSGGMDIGIRGDFKVHYKFLGNNKSKKKWIKLPKTKFDTVFANDIKKESLIFWEKKSY